MKVSRRTAPGIVAVVAVLLACGSEPSNGSSANAGMARALAAVPTRYVDCAAGNDSSSGTSSSSAWRTLARVNSESLSPGDVVGLKAGTTCVGTLTVRASGTSGSPITVTSYGSGSPAVIDPQNARWAIDVSGQYVTIDGVVIHNTRCNAGPCVDGGMSDTVVTATEAAVNITAGNVTVRNTEIVNTGFGIEAWAGNNTLGPGNSIHDLRMLDQGGSFYGAVCWEIRSGGNTVFSSRCVNAIALAPASGSGFDGGAWELFRDTAGSIDDNVFAWNWVDNTDGAAEMTCKSGCSSLSRNEWHHNVVHSRENVCGSWHSMAGIAATGNRWENNTCVGYAGETKYELIWFENDAAAAAVTYRNNVMVYASRVVYGNDQSSMGPAHDHNLYWRLGGGGSPSQVGAGGVGAGDLYADPQFVNIAAADYHPQPSSPAMGAGSTSVGYPYPGVDFDGTQVGSPTMGAFSTSAAFSGGSTPSIAPAAPPTVPPAASPPGTPAPSVPPAAGASLSVTLSGQGSGYVFGGGLSCGSGSLAYCTSSLATDVVAVKLSAVPAAGSRFTGWGGACAGTTECTIAVAPGATLEVTAAFEPLAAAAAAPASTTALSLIVGGAGQGTVTGAGLTCSAAVAECTADLATSTPVTLTATPQAGSVFVGWSGACSGTGSCTFVPQGQPASVGAQFEPAPVAAAPGATGDVTLTAALKGAGAGSIVGGGLSCSGAASSVCASSFTASTSVTVVATPEAGSIFAGWSGACSGLGDCVLSAAGGNTVHVEALFEPAGSSPAPAPTGTTGPRLSVSVNGTGNGYVAGGGVSCSSGSPDYCSSVLAANTTSVTLSAVAAEGSQFAGWSGACSGVGTCTVMTAGLSSIAVQATFR